MINIDDFIKRIEIILEYYTLSASAFADALGVQRSGLSHLLSGRNRPSLDLVMKITDTYPEVDLQWLLNGKGTFPPKENVETVQEPLPAPPKNITAEDKSVAKQTALPDLFSATEASPENEAKTEIAPAISSALKIENNTDIAQIVIFYTDGTFKNYKPG